MNTSHLKIVGRSVSALAIAGALALGGAGIASASSSHDHGAGHGNCASGRLSAFDYANGGTGGYVAALTATSVTVDGWNGTPTTFTITSATTFAEGGTATTAASLVVGDRVRIQTSSSAPSTAGSINIELAMLFGTVATVSGNTITIKDPQGFTRTILVSSTTTYQSGGSPGTLADVVVGAKILAAGTVDTNGTTLDALKVSVGTVGSNAYFEGTVTAATSSSLTVQNHGGTSDTFTLTTSTTYADGSLNLSAANLAVGEQVGVESNSTAATTALRVDIQLPQVAGRVVSVSGDTITVADHEGLSRIVLVGSSTLYFQGHGATGTLADLIVGAKVTATGTIDANGTTLDALSVTICNPVTVSPTPQVPTSFRSTSQGSWNAGHGFGGHSFGGHPFARQGHHRGQ